MARQEQMKIGVSIRGLGYHVSAWRFPDVDPAGSEKLEHFATSARMAEAAKLDFVFFADNLGLRSTNDPEGSAARDHNSVELEPLTLLAALSVLTKRIGLIATASTSYNEPFHIARKFASIDHLSGGRAGWNAVTTWTDLEARNFNRERHFEKAERYERADEFIAVVKGLWNSWDADAFIRDKTTGQFHREAGQHTLNHHGTHFRVQGPLTVSRTPQGRPLIVQAGASEQGLDLAGKYADLVYSLPRDINQGIKGRDELRARAGKFGRDPDDIKSLPGIQIVIGRTEAEARDKLEYLKEMIDPLLSMAQLRRQIGNIVTEENMDQLIPEDMSAEGKWSVAAATLRVARENRWTGRELCQQFGMGQHLTLCGTPDQVADTMALWFERGACDGFNLLPATTPHDVADIVEHVIPRLQDRSLFRKEYAGSSLRENLGLPRLDRAMPSRA